MFEPLAALDELDPGNELDRESGGDGACGASCSGACSAGRSEDMVSVRVCANESVSCERATE